MEELTDHAAKGGKEDPQGTALLKGHLHGLRDAQADAGGSLGDIAAEGNGQLAGLDVLHGDGAALGAGHRLFGDKEDIPLLHLVPGILKHHVLHAVRLGDQVGLDGNALIVHAVHGADQLLARVGGVYGLFAHWYRLLSTRGGPAVSFSFLLYPAARHFTRSG